ncbi:MAG: DUF1508 domain-containing protein [Patescibacteria group bacterium]
MVRFNIFKDTAGEYRWQLVAANNEIVGWSEGYTTKQGAINSAQWVKTNAYSAPINDLT